MNFKPNSGSFKPGSTIGAEYRFKKGCVSKNKGIPMKEETKLKLSLSRKGKPSPLKGIKTGRIPWNKGIPYLQEVMKDPIKKENILKGLKIGQNGFWGNGDRKGNKHWNWRGGITPINEKIRASTEYKLWRTSVFLRDNFTCVFCMKRGGKIQADHIKPFSMFPELRFSIDNGRTLCISCHTKTETYGKRMKYYKSEIDAKIAEKGK